MAIDFDTFLLSCLRRRPAHQDWTALVSHAALGLSSSALTLVGIAVSTTAPDTADVVPVLARFEYARALLYFHVDRRPGATGPAANERLRGAAVDLACGAGRIDHLVESWTGGCVVAYEHLQVALEDLEVDRARVYTALGLEPDLVWTASAGLSAPEARDYSWR